MSEPKTRYEKHEYQQAKAVIQGAEQLSSSGSPVYRYTLWKAQDGAIWAEHKSLLESPEDDYMLIRHGKVRAVTIPACAEHNGFYSMQVNLYWVCPVCGEPRGEPYDTISYDGSRRLGVHGWQNQCGHIDRYNNVREEAEINGLNESQP